jgi:hypothetical protein
MKQLFILMLLLFGFTIGNAQKVQQSEISGSKATPNGQQKAPQTQMRINFAEQEAIVNKFTNSFDSLTPMQQNMFFTNVKHIMDPEVTKIEPGIIDSDPWRRPHSVAATWQSDYIQEYMDQGIVNKKYI